MVRIKSLAPGFTLAILFVTNISAQTGYSTQTERQKVPVVVPSSSLSDKMALIEGKVVVVYDGDTISVQSPQKAIYSIRLQGIDAPEDKQNYSKKSRETLKKLLLGKDVRVVVHKKDLYDRHIGTVYADGLDIGLTQIETGMAWHFKAYGFQQSPESRRKYAQAELRARADRAGLWEDKEPTPPWVYRGEVVTAPSTAANPTSVKLSSAGNSSDGPSAPASGASGHSGRTYILGPRGGCYYVAENGRKVYVKDKSLCAK